MSATSPLAAIGALAIALATMYLLDRLFGVAPSPKRFRSLDGLRGYAAFLISPPFGDSVALRAIRRVELPPSRLYTHFGQSAVAISS